ncbi:tryptophan-rich sensory protein [Candidatus Microgenomates bacterium]|nr:MAG: tryptophan-rich sensory protein [Candidatus Microgenomates bacterium]
MKKFHLPALIAAILICQTAGLVGSVFTFSAIPTWYATLSKPIISPPNWVFGPVWTILFTLMGISAYLVWQEGWQKKQVKDALRTFGEQLVLNALWSILFFGLKNPLLAFVEIIFLWILIVATMVKFYRLNNWAAYLLLPYLIWVSFASILNGAIVVLN